jgi:PAS domain S-box-containing protein
MKDPCAIRKSAFAPFVAMLLAGELAAVLLLSPLMPLLPRLSAANALIAAILATSLMAAAAWWGSAKLMARVAPSEEMRLQARLGLLLQASSDGIVGADAERRITVFNEGAERIFGFTASEVIGRDLGVLLPDPYRASHRAQVARFAVGAADARAMEARAEFEGRRKNGEEFPVDIAIARSGAGDDQLFIAVVRDATDRRRTEAELRRAKDLADAGARAKSEFLANMSHEIRTPMNAVVGLTGLLLETSLTAEQRRYVEIVRSSSDALRSIIDDILDYSKIEAGKLEIERQPFDVRECVEAALDLLAASAAEKGVELAFLVHDVVPTVVTGDVTRLRQVIVNLLGNAVKFTHHGEVFVEVDAVPVGQDDIELEIAVRDSGIGIAPELRDQLFGAFSQGETSTTRHFGGTGLGLAITKRLAEMMGGRVWFESEAGVGSTFHAVLRLGTAAATRGRLQPVVHDTLRGRHVLVVDDNATSGDVLRRHLERCGAHVALADSGREGLATVKREPRFDIAIIDHQMPEMDGLELARQLRGLPGQPPVPIVMLRALGDHLTAPAGGGVVAVVTKPVKPAALLRAANAALDAALDAAPVADGVDRGVEHTLDPRLASRHPLRILLAEDNPVNQMVAVQILSRMGYQADVVQNGREALDAASARNYDLILTDVQMPEMDGLEAVRRMRQLPSRSGHRPRIVAMTASVTNGDRRAALDAGMDDFVGKPVRIEDLRDAILRSASSLEPTKPGLPPCASPMQIEGVPSGHRLREGF